MVGYFYWGFLGDKKFRNGKEVSTPDGNAFYSWSIISELQKRGYDVALYLDQDKEGYEKQEKLLIQKLQLRNGIGTS